MTKADFVDKLAAKSGLTKKDAASMVDAFVEVVTDSLKKGEDVQFTGFGKFYVQKREAREGINPQTKARSRSRPPKSPSSARAWLSRTPSSNLASRVRVQG